MKPKILNLNKRRAGVIAPLSALRGPDDCGVGDVAALDEFFPWMNEAGMSVIQLLPLSDLAPLDACPYTAISAFAMDVAYLAPARLPEVQTSPTWRAAWKQTGKGRASTRAMFPQTRRIKYAFLRKLFDALAFDAMDADFSRFRREHRDWIEDYALFRALQEERGWKSWSRWPKALRDRHLAALSEERDRLSRDILFHQWVQYRLFSQWTDVRKRAKRSGILLFGDIPFGLGKSSADVWARQGEFDFSASMGAPPDQYSDTGQAWGLPAYRWAEMEADGHHWWRARIRAARDSFDLFRIDHAIGFFRTWLIRAGRRGNGFDILTPSAQKARGKRFCSMVRREGAPARVIAEDLGLLPDFVPPVLQSLEIPGYKVARWEYEKEGIFQHPATYPNLSVAASGNHDVEPLAAWWTRLPKKEKKAYWHMVTGNGGAPRFSPSVRKTILENLYNAKSSLLLIQLQDALGTRERINTPGTVNNRNWRYRAPASKSAFTKNAPLLRTLAESSGRY
ncbi:MAG: 4-alpha-glucanotransferase [Elusimicrobia bacterium]|nr:MAG: 4-alpha-glucanotransferase [Elusimicrobiota bacterium]